MVKFNIFLKILALN